MSVYYVLMNYLNKESEDFMFNMRTLTKIFSDTNGSLLAGILFTTKSLEESVSVINKCYDMSLKLDKGSRNMKKMTVVDLLKNYLSKAAEGYVENLNLLIYSFKDVRIPLLAAILYQKGDVTETIRHLKKTLAMRQEQTKRKPAQEQEGGEKKKMIKKGQGEKKIEEKSNDQKEEGIVGGKSKDKKMVTDTKDEGPGENKLRKEGVAKKVEEMETENINSNPEGDIRAKSACNQLHQLLTEEKLLKTP